MNATTITIGDVLETKAFASTTMGKIRDRGFIIPGTRVKIIREEEPSRYKCEVQPVEKENGSCFVFLWASELKKPCEARSSNNP
jgi:hypothetical protein